MTSEPLSEKDADNLFDAVSREIRTSGPEWSAVLNLVARIRDEAVAAAEREKAEILDTAIRYKRERNEAKAAERAVVERMMTVAVEMETRAQAFRGTGIGDAYSNAVSYICAALDIDRDALSARPEAARGEGER